MAKMTNTQRIENLEGRIVGIENSLAELTANMNNLANLLQGLASQSEKQSEKSNKSNTSTNKPKKREFSPEEQKVYDSIMDYEDPNNRALVESYIVALARVTLSSKFEEYGFKEGYARELGISFANQLAEGRHLSSKYNGQLYHARRILAQHVPEILEIKKNKQMNKFAFGFTLEFPNDRTKKKEKDQINPALLK